MHYKKVIAVVFASVFLALSFTSCANPYKKGVDYSDFPDDDIPIYDDAVVFSFEADGDEMELSYGTEDDVDDIADFYKDTFDDSDYIIVKEREEKDEYEVRGYIGDTYFEIEAEEAKRDEEEYFDAVVTIELEFGQEPEASDAQDADSIQAEADAEDTSESQEDEPEDDLAEPSPYVLLNNMEHTLVQCFEGEDSIYFSKLFLSSDNHIILIGGTAADEGNLTRIGSATYDTSLYDNAGNCSDALIAKLDFEGNIIWRQQFPTTNSGIYYYEISDNGDDTYTFAYMPGNDNSKILSVTVDIDGNIITQEETDDQFDYNYPRSYITVKSVSGGEKIKCEIVDDSIESDYPTLGVNKIDLGSNGYLFYTGVSKDSSVNDILPGFHAADYGLYAELIDTIYHTDKEYCDNYAYDLLVIKTDDEGYIDWHRFCGGSGGDGADFAAADSDGNYYFKGSTWSLDGDVPDWPRAITDSWTGEGSDKYPTSHDWYLILDADGNLIYSQCQSPPFDIISAERCFEMPGGKYMYFENDRFLPEGAGDWLYNYKSRINIYYAQ